MLDNAVCLILERGVNGSELLHLELLEGLLGGCLATFIGYCVATRRRVERLFTALLLDFFDSCKHSTIPVVGS